MRSGGDVLITLAILTHTLVSRLHVREAGLPRHILRASVLLLHQSSNQMERLLVHLPGMYRVSTPYMPTNPEANSNTNAKVRDNVYV